MEGNPLALSHTQQGKPRLIEALLAWLPRGQTLPEGYWAGRHRAILVIAWLHVVAIPVYAVIRGFGFVHGVIESVVVAAPAALASAPSMGRRVRTIASSVACLSSSAVLVHLSGGVIEAHFHFFVMVALIALYQDWVPFLTAIAYVLIHHGLMGSLDPRSVYNHQPAWNRPWVWAGIHALFIVGMSAVCLVTWRLNENLMEGRKRAEGRLKILAEAGAALTSTLDAKQMLQAVSELIAPAVVDVCIFDLLAEDGSIERVAFACDTELEQIEPAIDRARAPSGPNHPIARMLEPAMRSFPGRESDRPVETKVYAASELPFIAHLRLDRAATVVLTGRRHTLGTMTVATRFRWGRMLDDDDVRFVEDLGRRAAAAIENSLLYRRERSVSETLQHSLLPERLPEVPGLQATARYRPGGPGVEVGGDWYDVIALSGGSLALAMGDVVGHGEKAAALMGQLRNAVRAYAIESITPAEVMERLNRLMNDLGRECMATMIYAIVDPDTGTLRLVNAGHPPPIVIAASGGATLLDLAPGVPLGAMSHARYSETVSSLQAGSTLVFYTDGLIEHRGEGIEEGFARLQRTADEGPEELEDLCDHLLERLVDNDHQQDDVALLLLRFLPLGDELELEIPNDPAALTAARTTLRRWVAAAGASEQETYEIVVAVGEACANAAHHAGGPAPSTFDLLARIDRGVVEVRIRDYGRWRTERQTGFGRGLQIMRAFTDSLDIRRLTDGTEVVLTRALRAHSHEGVMLS